jgi:uncharacterized membrane protein
MRLSATRMPPARCQERPGRLGHTSHDQEEIMTIDPALKRIRGMLPDRLIGMPYQNINQLHDESMTLGQKVADGVAHNMGSWRFILIQSTLLLMWITANIAFAAHELSLFGLNFKAWDIYPFILLNLALSFQAAYAAPFIMMSQNRQADKDRLAAEHDYHVNIRAEATVRAILEHLKAQDEVILAILRQQQEASGMSPSEAQKLAEKNLQDVQKWEQEVVSKTIKEEELEAGIHT